MATTCVFPGAKIVASVTIPENPAQDLNPTRQFFDVTASKMAM